MLLVVLRAIGDEARQGSDPSVVAMERQRDQASAIDHQSCNAVRVEPMAIVLGRGCNEVLDVPLQHTVPDVEDDEIVAESDEERLVVK